MPCAPSIGSKLDERSLGKGDRKEARSIDLADTEAESPPGIGLGEARPATGDFPVAVPFC